MTPSRLADQIRFIVEIDKLKGVFRRTYLMDKSRQENDAEHSWHLAVMAILLSEYAAQQGVDVLRVVKMVLIHDLVEIDAGDTFCYDEAGHADKPQREQAAADRIFPLLHNYHTEGAAWREHGITVDRVLDRNGHMAEGAPALWDYAERFISDAVERGYLAPAPQ